MASLTLACAALCSLPSDIVAQEPATAPDAPVVDRQTVDDVPSVLTEFTPYTGNPIFTGEGPGHWDAKIRERGWILRDGDRWHLWFTGYDGSREGLKMLGHATSTDGLAWRRDPEGPIYREHWVEDMTVVRHDGVYYMFAEGLGDQAHLLTSNDGLAWTRRGTLDVRYTDGRPLTKGPFGTPTVWIEDGLWHLFYERMDRGVWLATSRDLKTWTNIDDRPVLVPGPDAYDRMAIAMNQVIKHQGRYYASYHGTGDEAAPREWCSCLAVSDDLRHWRKWAQNPLVGDNQSSNLYVPDGDRFRLYTMHDEVRAYRPRAEEEEQP